MERIAGLRERLDEFDVAVGILTGLLLMMLDSVAVLFVSLPDLSFFVSLGIVFLAGTITGTLLSVKCGGGIRLKNITHNWLIFCEQKPILCTLIIVVACLCFWVTDYLPLNTWGIDYHELAWHSNKYYILLSGVATAAILHLVNAKATWTLHDSTQRSTKKWILYYLLISAFAVVSLWQPGTDIWYSIYHRHAYFYEIYARYNLMPYSVASSGVYGHYGIFYLPLLKLMGGCTTQSITAIVCTLGVVTSLLFSLSVHTISKCRIVRLAVPIAALLPLFWSSKMQLYYQGYPHRFFLSSLFCYLLAQAIASKESKRCWAFRHVAATFALIWSSDMGIAFLTAVLAWDIVEAIAIRKSTRYIFCAFGWAAIEFVVALLIVNFYNICVGGKIIFLDFFFPYTTSYVSGLDVGLIREEYAGFFSLAFWFAYFWILAFYLAVAFICFFRAGTSHQTPEQSCKMDIALVAASFYGVCSMVYYINRPAYGNLLQTLPTLVFCLSGLIEKSTYSQKVVYAVENRLKGILLQSVLTVIAMGTVLSLPCSLSTLVVNQQSPDAFLPAAVALEKSVPDNTLCIGVGAFETSSHLKWDNLSLHDNIHFPYSSTSQQAAIGELSENESFVVFNINFGGKLIDVLDGLDELIDTYEAQEQYSSDVVSWTFYVKK